MVKYNYIKPLALLTTLGSFFLYFLSLFLLDFPHMTQSFLHKSLSILIMFFLVVYSYVMIHNKKMLDLSYVFNLVWLFSISLSLMSLSNVQYDLTLSYLAYLLITILSFNIGYIITDKCGFNDEFTKITSQNTSHCGCAFIHDRVSFKFYFFTIAFICCIGYLYEIYVIGFIPIFMAYEEGFFDNMAGFLSIVHYFATSLGAIAGASLAYYFVSKRSKAFYFIIFSITFTFAVSLLTKNITFLAAVFFAGLMKFYNKLSIKTFVYFATVFVFLTLLSSAIRTGSSEYIEHYSLIDYYGLPSTIYWLNTYFAVNITHLNTYFEQGYTATYGLSTVRMFTSLLFLKDSSSNIIGDQIVYYNGLGGNINVTPLFYTFMTDYYIFSFVPILFLGIISGYVNRKLRSTTEVLFAVIYSGLLYVVLLSVFGDFLTRLMVPIAIVFVYLPYYFASFRYKNFKISRY